MQRIRSYIPLIIICFVFVFTGACAYISYFNAYFILNGFKVYIDSLQVLKETQCIIRINFSVFNPSDRELKLTYLKPMIYLNEVGIKLNEPSFIRYSEGYELSIPPGRNVTIVFSRNIMEPENFEQLYANSRTKNWFLNVYLTLRNVPLLDLATLQRYISYSTG